MSYPRYIEIDKNLLEQTYKKCGSLCATAKFLGISRTIITQRLIEYKIPYKGVIRYSLNENLFKQETAEVFYIAGLLAADGCVRINNKNSNSYEIMLTLKEEDKYHLTKIKNIISCKERPLQKKINKDSQRNPKWKDSIAYILKLSSKIMFNDLAKFNIVPNKSLTCQFPIHLKDHPLISYFMLGYFDGDDSIGFDKNTSNSARIHLRGTINFLQEFHNILYKKCNLKNKERKISMDSGIGSLQYTGNPSVYKILTYLYGDSKLFLKRKHKRYKKLEKKVLKKNKVPQIIT